MGNRAVWDDSYKALADLRSCQFHFVKTVSNDTVTVCATANEAHLGILQNQPNSGQTAVVRLAGKSKLVGGATVAVNNLITTNASGYGNSLTLTSGHYTMALNSEAMTSTYKTDVILRGACVRAQ